MIVKFNKSNFAKFASKEVFDRIVDFDNVKDLVLYIKKEYSNLNAIGKEDGTLATYAEFYQDVLRVFQLLKDNNVSKKAHVGLVCNNNYKFAVASVGIMAYGAVAVLLPSHLDDKTLYGCSLKYDLSVVIAEDSLYEKLHLVENLAKKPVLRTSDIFNETPCSEEEFVNNEVSKSDDACIIMTGGTTGRSKGAVLTHDALLCGILNGTYGIEHVWHQTYYCLIPLTHVFGFIRNFMTSLYSGSLIYFNTDKRKMFEELKRFQPTQLIVVPALAELFLNLVKAYGLGFIGGKVKTIICGAANVPPYLVKEYDKLGIIFCPGYGLTEFSNMVSGNPTGLINPESVGMLYPDQEAKLVNGELWLKGRNQMRCYYNEDEENKNAFEDGWFKTGDLARFDENNNLYIIGRIKDVIVLANGENVSPAELEAKFCKLDFVQDALVYEFKNNLGLNVLRLEVTLRQIVINSLNLDDVNKYVIDKLQEVNNTFIEHERVSEIIIRTSDFERSPSMKILRPKKLY